VRSLNLATCETRSHALAFDPFCPGCGQPRAAAPPLPLELASRKVAFVQDGGHRAVSPEQTLHQYRHLVSPITGRVRMLEPVHQADGIVHVYAAGHNYALRMDKLDFLRRNLRNASAGKGITASQAKASALCEALERDAGFYTGREYRITARYRDLGADAIHPAACMFYSERQYREREAWNARKSRFNWVPEPFDEERPLYWSPVWSLTEKRHKYLPTQYLYFKAKAGDDCDADYCHGCSNGNASGNNLEEAVLQGFCELVERDAVALWWYNRLSRAGVDLASFGEPYLLDLVAYYAGRNREAWALDITSDLGIPVFVAVSRCRAEQERILFGMGCHLDARIALLRAFSEMNQMLGMSGDIDGSPSKVHLEDRDTLNWLKTATLASQPYLVPAARRPPAGREDFPKLASGDLLADIDYCRGLVEARGMEMLVLDQTRPDLGLPVVKVIVPGLRHFWARFAPGRLYDVPVQMGWLEQPLAEEALNPISMFL
jgi:thiazole/oxazole-forming peptide maturase SagD family component